MKTHRERAKGTSLKKNNKKIRYRPEPCQRAGNSKRPSNGLTCRWLIILRYFSCSSDASELYLFAVCMRGKRIRGAAHFSRCQIWRFFRGGRGCAATLLALCIFIRTHDVYMWQTRAYIYVCIHIYRRNTQSQPRSRIHERSGSVIAYIEASSGTSSWPRSPQLNLQPAVRPVSRFVFSFHSPCTHFILF